MSVRTEWLQAADAVVSYEPWVDAYGSASDGPALVIGFDAAADEDADAHLIALAELGEE